MEEEEDVINLDTFFNIALQEKSFEENNNQEPNSLNDLLALSFSTYLIPLNHLCADEEPNAEEGMLTLAKFKELNLNKVQEDMLYYCSPADILSKLDTNNSDYIFQESNIEFYNDE